MINLTHQQRTDMELFVKYANAVLEMDRRAMTQKPVQFGQPYTNAGLSLNSMNSMNSMNAGPSLNNPQNRDSMHQNFKGSDI